MLEEDERFEPFVVSVGSSMRVVEQGTYLTLRDKHSVPHGCDSVVRVEWTARARRSTYKESNKPMIVTPSMLAAESLDILTDKRERRAHRREVPLPDDESYTHSQGVLTDDSSLMPCSRSQVVIALETR